MKRWDLQRLASTLPDNKGNEWVDEANCLGKDTSMFVYASKEPTASERYKLEQICKGCPVMLTCRYEAVRNMEVGWWGGMTPSERMAWAERELFV